MVVKFKKLSESAITPSRVHAEDAGLDFYASGKGRFNAESSYLEYPTGIALEIPAGYVGLMFPRSSISKCDLILANSVGVIDSNYRGEITFRFKISGSSKYHEVLSRYDAGDRIGQLLIILYSDIELEEADELSITTRGTGGYGSTGSK